MTVDNGFATTITAINSLGVTLSNREFELLQGKVNGYWGLRLLNQAAISRKKTEQRAELDDNNEMKLVKKEVKMPYGGVELPDIEKVYDSLRNVKNAVNLAFDRYCGANYELKDVVFPIDRATEETNARIEAAYGVKAQPQKLDNMTISRMASSKKCFDENHHAYADFLDMMKSLEATMPKPERKTVLTDSDRNLIDSMIDSKYEFAAKEQAARIAKADRRLAEILLLDPRYSKVVRAAVGMVSDDE